MNFKKIKFPVFLFLICFGLTACNENKPESSAKNSETVASVLDKSTSFERDTVRKDATKVVLEPIRNPRNNNWYTYNYYSANVKPIEATPAEIGKSTIKKVTPNQELKDKEIDIRMAVYTVSETDRPPLFGSSCLEASNPEECSNKAIEDFIKSNINFPNKAITKGHDGLEIVSFIINENGEVEDKIEVLSKDTPCKNCAKAAVDVVANMENWTPAMVDGKPVKVQVSLPIRFETKDQISLK